jgi:deoxyribodipyrimidine photo-lyase
MSSRSPYRPTFLNRACVTSARHRILHFSIMARAAKRKATTNGVNGVSKKARSGRSSLSTSPERVNSKPSASTDPLRQPHPFHDEAEENGIVLRKYYPHEMSNARARAYNADELPRPIEVLREAMTETSGERRKVKVKDAVVHWFKMDLRTKDNQALSAASYKAQQANVPLIAMYIVSPQDFEAHLTSPARVDFTLRTLKVLREDLAKLDIPLYIETVDKRKLIPGRIIELMEEWGANHLFANMEYEVDELRREAELVRLLSEKGMAMEVMQDTCVVPPGQLTSGSGKQYAVYSPWFRAWVAHIHDNPELIELLDAPAKNPPIAREKFSKLFDCNIPDAPKNKKLSTEDAKRYSFIWPPGEHEAMKRLDTFCEERVGKYGTNRNLPAESGTSSLSVHFASGTLSARTAVRTARDRNRTKKLNGGNEGIQTWISEVAWRDFYKHVLVNWPFVW